MDNQENNSNGNSFSPAARRLSNSSAGSRRASITSLGSNNARESRRASVTSVGSNNSNPRDRDEPRQERRKSDAMLGTRYGSAVDVSKYGIALMGGGDDGEETLPVVAAAEKIMGRGRNSLTNGNKTSCTHAHTCVYIFRIVRRTTYKLFSCVCMYLPEYACRDAAYRY